jgi:thiamine-monophosphate kinase
MADVITSETGLVQEFLAPLAVGEPGAFGLLDDCAVLTPRPGMDFVVKTDPVVAGVHFFPNDKPGDIAWKALAVNVSDLASKGASPRAYLLALSFPQAPEREWMRAFAEGLREAQTAFGCTLIGGDTDKVAGPLSIAVTVIGEVPTGRMVRRGTAKAGDLIFVSGSIGDSALGLHARTNGFARKFWPIDAEERTVITQRYLRPAPRLGLRVAVLSHASASMDVSDGLAKDLGRMAAASGVAATVQLTQVPLSTGGAKIAAAIVEWQTRVLSGGDDYEILCAIPPQRVAGFQKDATAAGVRVTEIGVFGSGAGLTILDQAGVPVVLDRTGWDHFG